MVLLPEVETVTPGMFRIVVQESWEMPGDFGFLTVKILSGWRQVKSPVSNPVDGTGHVSTSLAAPGK